MPDWENLCRTFALAATTGDVDALRMLLTESTVLRTNAIGDAFGREAVCACIAHPICSWEQKRLCIENLCFDGEKAEFAILAVHGIGNTLQRLHFVRYALSCTLRLNRGTVEEIWLDVCWADGNTWQLGLWQPQEPRWRTVNAEYGWERARRMGALLERKQEEETA